MPDIFNVNSENIIGGPGRLVFKNYDGTFPDTIEEVMSPTDPYALVEGWTDLVATSDGITIARSFETTDFEVDQVLGAVGTDISGWSHTLTTTLAENTVENRKLALVGGTIIESPPILGTATTLTAPIGTNGTMLAVTSAVGMAVGGFVSLSEGANIERKKISRIVGSTVYLASPVENSYTIAASVSPITELGNKRIGFGTVENIPTHTYALISQKKDGTLYMCVIRKANISGESKDQVFGKEKRLLPLQLTAFPEDSAAQEENVYYEIEQVI